MGAVDLPGSKGRASLNIQGVEGHSEHFGERDTWILQGFTADLGMHLEVCKTSVHSFLFSNFKCKSADFQGASGKS